MKIALLLTSVLLSGCAVATGTIATAAVNTAIAATASGISRANGGCYAACPEGTTCNEHTGLCETLACRGLCAADEQCAGAGLTEHCVRRADGFQVEGSVNRPNYLPAPNNLPEPAPVAPNK